jgi:hypothetical protein
MYVAGSESVIEPVFEKYLRENPQHKGVQLDFEHKLVPFQNVAKFNICRGDTSNTNGSSLLQSFVDSDNIDNFGSEVVQAIVQFKWQTYGRLLFMIQFGLYSIGLAFLVAVSIILGNHPDPCYLVKAGWLCGCFGLLNLFSFIREFRQFWNSRRSASSSSDKGIVTHPDSTWCRKVFLVKHFRAFWRYHLGPFLHLSRNYFSDFWNFLDVLNICLGYAVVGLVVAQSPSAQPVLAITCCYVGGAPCFVFR